jgi:hypothetical protein
MTLLTEIEAALRHCRMAPSRFGREVAGDPRLVFDLQRGRSPGPELAARVRHYLSQISGRALDG